MSNTIKLKSSSTASTKPSALEFGELAINYKDGVIFYKDPDNNIVNMALKDLEVAAAMQAI